MWLPTCYKKLPSTMYNLSKLVLLLEMPRSKAEPSDALLCDYDNDVKVVERDSHLVKVASCVNLLVGHIIAPFARYGIMTKTNLFSIVGAVGSVNSEILRNPRTQIGIPAERCTFLQPLLTGMWARDYPRWLGRRSCHQEVYNGCADMPILAHRINVKVS